MNNNPFISTPSAAAFVGRSKEIRRIVGRIANGGQSVAVTAESGMGKNALLTYLAAPEKRVELYGDLAPRLLFQYFDAQTFGVSFTPARFWQLALSPLAEKLAEISSPAVKVAYTTCESEGFGVYGLEKLLAQIQAAGWRLVLLLDEFDNLLDHPVLNKSEFYGGLRSLATRCESLALITASRQPVEALNAATQDYSRMGSPYFNFMNQVSLGAFSEKEAHTLLARGDEHFTKNDKDFLFYIAGGHPSLLLAAAYALWDAYEDPETNPNRQTCWESTSRDLLEAARPILADTWRVWTPEKRKVITVIALDTLPKLVAGKEFDIKSLLASFQAFTPEVDELKKRGFLLVDPETNTGYRLQAQVMLWWLAEELIRATRPQEGEDWGEWLRKQQWEGLIKGEEKTQLKEALTILSTVLKPGIDSVIKSSVDMSMRKGLRVFLCHSSSDKPKVREIYNRLSAERGISPWLDEKNLLPGDDWNLEIHKAIKDASVVVVCLSPQSINKDGYVQKEIKIALDVADEKPESTIFIIPLKLEECTVPERLSTWQWLNYSEDGAYGRLVSALRKRAQVLGMDN